MSLWIKDTETYVVTKMYFSSFTINSIIQGSNLNLYLLHIAQKIYLDIRIYVLQIAISASNTGGAWDNAKKYIEVSYTQHSTFTLCI